MPVDKFGRMSDTKTKDTGVSLTYINNNYVRSDGETPLTGSLDMRGNTIYNVADPVNPQDVVTKVYVDNTKGSGVIGRKTKDGVSIKENLDFLGKQKIKNLPDPEQDNEPATKKYVDDLQTHYIDKKGNIKFDRNINVGNHRIFSVKDPKKDYEATNKKYVDDSITKRLQEEKDNFLPQDPATKEYVDEAIKGIAGGDILVSKEGVFIKANGHYRATAPLDIDNHKMENLPDPVDEKDAVNKKYIDGIVENLTLKQGLIRENGGFNLVDSYINMNFNNIRNVGYPQHNEDVVPRSFVDNMIKEVEEKIQKIKEKSEERPFLKENGNYQASTLINMNFNKLLNLQKPTEPYDAATKDYVDYVEKEIKEKLEKRKHLITVYANYTGPLFYNKFQFSFGGNEAKNSVTGFLIPQSGRIKKIKMRTPINKESFNKRVIEKKKKLNSDFRNGFFEFSIKKVVDGLYHTIGKIRCKEAYNLYEYDEEGNKKWFPFYDFCFDDPLPLIEDSAEVEEGDILNIRTIINSEFDFPPYSDKLDSDAFSLYKKDPHIGNTYLVTFLIELDPL